MGNILVNISIIIKIKFHHILKGLQSSKMQSYFYLDDTQQRYEKLRDSAETFSLLQFGMTCFSWNSSSKAFTPFAFSFFIFSDPSKLMRLEKRFSFQASSVAFLAENKFNFNKVFYDGIPFLSGAEEKVFRDKKGLAGNCSTHAAEENPLTLTSENQKFVDEKMYKNIYYLLFSLKVF